MAWYGCVCLFALTVLTALIVLQKNRQNRGADVSYMDKRIAFNTLGDRV